MRIVKNENENHITMYPYPGPSTPSDNKWLGPKNSKIESNWNRLRRIGIGRYGILMMGVGGGKLLAGWKPIEQKLGCTPSPPPHPYEHLISKKLFPAFWAPSRIIYLLLVTSVLCLKPAEFMGRTRVSRQAWPHSPLRLCVCVPESCPGHNLAVHDGIWK